MTERERLILENQLQIMRSLDWLLLAVRETRGLDWSGSGYHRDGLKACRDKTARALDNHRSTEDE